MSTASQLSENSHQGFDGIKAALCLASMKAKSNTASGMQPCLRQDRIGSRSSGKERDAETGLDYFGARYFSSPLGRFTTADPMLNSAKPWNPQTWNRYSYGINNPVKFVDPNGLYNLINTCAANNNKCNKQFTEYAGFLKTGLSELQKEVDQMNEGTEKKRLQAALNEMGKENDNNKVNVLFGPAGNDASAKTDLNWNNQTNRLEFDVTFDPKHITSGTAGWGIAAAHEGTHVADMSDPRYSNPATTLSDFQLEYRGYQTSAWAASAFGWPSLRFDRYEIWNVSWGKVDDKMLTQYLTSIKDKQGRQAYPDTKPNAHNPWPN
jgi:RHS repeat-associated protein